MTAHKLGITWEKFQNIFCLGSEDLLRLTEETSITDPVISFLSTVTADFLSKDEFLPPSEINNGDIKLYLQANENGETFAVLEYLDKSNSRSNVLVLIGEICLASASDERVSFIPHFIMNGHKNLSNGITNLVPQTILGRVIHPDFDSTPQFLEFDPTDSGDISESLCYAEECLKRIISSSGLDCLKAQVWIETDDATLDKQINYISSRSPNDLRREIKKLSHKEQLRKLENFEFPAPQGLQ